MNGQRSRPDPAKVAESWPHRRAQRRRLLRINDWHLAGQPSSRQLARVQISTDWMMKQVGYLI